MFQVWCEGPVQAHSLGIQVPSQKVRLDPPNLHNSAEHITVPEKVRLDPYIKTGHKAPTSLQAPSELPGPSRRVPSRGTPPRDGGAVEP